MLDRQEHQLKNQPHALHIFHSRIFILSKRKQDLNQTKTKKFTFCSNSRNLFEIDPKTQGNQQSR